MEEFNFEEVIKKKSDEELIIILATSQNYKPQFIELVKSELSNERKIGSTKDFFDGKSNEELIDYLEKWKFKYEFISLVKNELNERNLTYENKELIEKVRDNHFTNKEEKIHGWLVVFLIAIGIGGLLSPFMGFSRMDIADYDIGLGLFWANIGMVCDGILLLGYTALAVYIIISFLTYKPNAVLLGKAYLIIVFIINVIFLIGGEYESKGVFSLSETIRSLIWGVIWFLYLTHSEQVKRLFPKKQRTIFTRDKLLLTAIVGPVIIWLFFSFVLGIALGFKEGLSQINKEKLIDERTLSENEYTDGLIIFECPDGLIAEKQEMDDGDTFYTLYNDDVSITIFSAYDENDSPEYFEKIMQDWTNDSFSDFEYDVEKDRHELLNGNSFYLKTLQYETYPVIKWTFSLLFNKETGGCCVISYYSMTDTDYLKELINSIRF